MLRSDLERYGEVRASVDDLMFEFAAEYAGERMCPVEGDDDAIPF